MEKREMLYEGKAKQIFKTEKEDELIVYYKDDATAFDGEKKGQIYNKGIMNNRISNFFFEYLEDRGIKTHYLQDINQRETLVRSVEIIPIEVVMRNIAAGSLSRRLGLEEGTSLPEPVLEFYYKDDDLGDPLINESHIKILDLASPGQLAEISEMAGKINELLVDFLQERGIDLVDFKLEFGLTGDQEIILADEISPDTCRFWDSETGEKLDKDRFRRDLGDVEAAYQEMLRRITGNEEM